MGLKVLPEKMLRRLCPEDRAALGKAGRTAGECEVVRATCAEKELQRQIEADLNRRELFFVRSRMDRRTSVRVGLPDFLIILPGGFCLAIEVKVQGGVVSDDQKACFTDYWDKTGRIVYIVWSFEQYLEVLKNHALAHL